MKKLLLPLFILWAFSASSQNVAINPPANQDDQPQVAMNNTGPDNQSKINFADNIQNNAIQQQTNVQQSAEVNRGNFFNTGNNNPAGTVRQQKYGQSVQISAGVSGYSGSSGKATLKSHAHKSFDLVMKKTFRPKYKHPKHYGHKARVRRCASF